MHASSKETRPLRYAIADDHRMFRVGLLQLLSTVKHIHTELVLEAANGKELLEGLERATLLPEVCILDISMHPMNGFATTEAIRKRWPEMGILILSAYSSHENMGRMFYLGANGFLTKDCHPRVVKEALLDIREKGMYIDNLAPELISSLQQHKLYGPQLTATEQLFLQFCCSDLSYEEIAVRMKLSHSSVRGHARRLSEKLDVSSRLGLIMYAIDCGLYQPGLAP